MEPIPGMVGYHLYRVLKEPVPVRSIKSQTRCTWFWLGYGTGCSNHIQTSFCVKKVRTIYNMSCVIP
ncbi:hypothetical protein HanOQP8_Chr08g0294071 [Helianthus annuus]|nr:hypothetical protein HanLR1_Chr08g0286541 [Helianthus annuus]KAJ0723095.1 hypothetical protein HanOQP8_Chr08g0294071 [Helianthus annuus]